MDNLIQEKYEKEEEEEDQEQEDTVHTPAEEKAVARVPFLCDAH
jgi:hypothetical protein